jgi:restriction system protein
VAVPDFQTMMRPLLVIHDDGAEHEIADTRQAIADHFSLSAEDRSERIPSGRVTTLQNRVGWAAMYLYRAGLLERPRRAHYRITGRGQEMLQQHPERIDLSVLKQFEEFEEFRSAGTPGPSAESGGEQLDTASATAEERIDAGYQELRSALAADLLDRIRERSWEFFERMVLEVLRAMGYGGPEGSVERLGGHGVDEGVDGVIREDPLGLELIYIQAKSWEGTVGRPEIQRFIGALQGKQATKGIFITTSKFSGDAEAYAQSVASRVILIDGRRLAELMIDHNVGVSTREAYELKEVDLSYFSPEEEVAPS